MAKNLIFFPNVDFDSSKEASWGTGRNAKNHKSLPSTFTEKIKKKTPKCPKMGHFWGKLAFLEIFLDFLNNCTWQIPVVFCWSRWTMSTGHVDGVNVGLGHVVGVGRGIGQREGFNGHG